MLRLVAVALVLFNHATFSTEAFPPAVAAVLEALRRGGWVGVDLFFVLSGYLVSGLLFNEHEKHGSVHIGTFLLRRGMKIYPAFWVLLAYTCFSMYRRGAEFPPKDVLGELLFLQNYLGQLWGHTWSLAIEEHFYIGLALLIALLQRRSSAAAFMAIPYVFIFVATICLALRIWEVRNHPLFDWHAHMTPTHLRADSLFFGVLLSYATRYQNLTRSLRALPTPLMILAACTLLLPAFVFHRDDHRWLTVTGFVLFYLAGGLLVLSFVRIKFSSNRVVRTMAALGAASYSIYLWHGPMVSWTKPLSHSGSALGETVYLGTFIAGSLLLGYFMSRLVEVPVLHLRDRYFRSRAASLPTRQSPSSHPGHTHRDRPQPLV